MRASDSGSRNSGIRIEPCKLFKKTGDILETWGELNSIRFRHNHERERKKRIGPTFSDGLQLTWSDVNWCALGLVESDCLDS